jgi:hypothetical protein
VYLPCRWVAQAKCGGPQALDTEDAYASLPNSKSVWYLHIIHPFV